MTMQEEKKTEPHVSITMVRSITFPISVLNLPPGVSDEVILHAAREQFTNDPNDEEFDTLDLHFEVHR